MSKLIKRWFFVLPVSAFFIAYMFWLFRAYYDVAYMDTIQILAGNINNMYNNDASLHDYYYRTPFLLFFSTILTFINCKLFSYNSFYENILSGFILLLIALYYINTNVKYFTRSFKILFSIVASLVVFSFIKWEMSLWGGGYSHYVVVFFGLICLDISHKYYIGPPSHTFAKNYFLPVYVILSMMAILETTSYFLPFQVSLIILLLVNFKIFREKINLKRWRIVLFTTCALVIFAIVINYMAEAYAIKNPYDVYGKVNVSQNIGNSFKKIFTEPGFVFKFFLVANAGTIIDKDSYPAGAFARNIMPFVGLVLLLLYAWVVYLFIKKKKIEATTAVNLIIYTVILYCTILIARMGFDDVMYGGSSRYTAATFLGTLGLTTFFLMILDKSNLKSFLIKTLYTAPLILILICSLIVYKNQWQMAPYRKESYKKMAENLKSNTNLESLMAYNTDLVQKARQMMIRHKLNVFKPVTKAENFTVRSDLTDINYSGFYDQEISINDSFRWTNGKGEFYLPNLYTISDTVIVKLASYAPMADTPVVVLNDNLMPMIINKVEDGYYFTYVFQEQKVFYKALVKSKSYIPNQQDKDSPDHRTLGLIFHSLTFTNK